jgi:demethylmenaquinone methyltransferase/2-methoxy-6-polyprenyl-1,4-benzoquinol methylase
METKEVFDKVASKYDIMNDIMSLGAHRYWKELLIDWLSPEKEMHIIDVAGGTGDVARRFLKRVKGKGKATVCDPNEFMVEEGKKNHTFKDKIEWIVASAEDLPFKENTFDAYLVSFGVRNFSNIEKSLDEAYRVLKPGGKFYCLEFSKAENETISSVYNFYSSIIPVMGKIIVGDEKPYEYLTKTISNFPSQENFKKIIEGTKFKDVNYRNIFNGIVAMHNATKIINAQ